MTRQHSDHPFDHLGPPPYRFVGLWSLPSKGLLEANPEAYNRAMADAPRLDGGGVGTCHHCGTPITHVCIIECGDGKRYGVGTTCVRKTFREPALLSELEKAVRDQKAAQRAKREARKQQERLEWVEENREQLAELPHPTPHFAKQGKTLADYVAYCGATKNVVATAKRTLATT